MGNYTKKEKTHFIRIPPEENFFGKLYRMVYFCVIIGSIKRINTYEQGRKNKAVHRRKDGPYF